MIAELLPCPFCGGKAELIEDPDDAGPRVNCIGTDEGGCEMEGPRAYWGDYEDAEWAREWAVEQWNTRASVTEAPAPSASSPA